jgi:rhodanese-related sulfurtransferase
MVLCDDRGVRADMSASWLAQMGWEVFVLDGGFEGALETGPARPRRPASPAVQSIDPESLRRGLADDRLEVLDLAPSPTHRRGHIPGAWFVVRAGLAEAIEVLPKGKGLVLTSPDGALAAHAARELDVIADVVPFVLEGGTSAWTAAGHPLESGMSRAASPPIDVYRRPYEGSDHSRHAMQAYLDWEFGLVEQLEKDGSHGFFVI